MHLVLLLINICRERNIYVLSGDPFIQVVFNLLIRQAARPQNTSEKTKEQHNIAYNGQNKGYRYHRKHSILGKLRIDNAIICLVPEEYLIDEQLDNGCAVDACLLRGLLDIYVSVRYG